MKFRSLIVALLLAVLAIVVGPVVSAGKRHSSHTDTRKIPNTASVPDSSQNLTVSTLYERLKLDSFGLEEKVLEYALKGQEKLEAAGKIRNAGILSICDFSQSSRKKRLYVIDLESRKVVMNTYVAHGRNSGSEYATSFSNTPESHKSSLGFYVTENTYYGEHGLALKIRGLDKGFNDRAWDRAIVIHGAKYADDRFLRANPFLGRSFGCPAIPYKDSEELINTIKGGTCLFIYHPTQKYLKQSKIINT